jgi:PKD repeat protein
MPCVFESINFFDASAGNPITWNWIFTGGNPPVSNVQNPTGIAYSSPGSYDVSLTVSDGLTTNELLLPGYIQVFGNPEQPAVPSGDSILCQSSAPQEYFTSGQANATDFQWKLEPSNAGALTPNWTLCSVDWAADFQGVASLSVKQLTNCGSSDYSTPVTIELNPLPIVNLGADQLVPASASVVLDAGNNGVSYLWSTGQTTSSITVDSTGYGLGAALFWVQVANTLGCVNSDTVIITFSTNIGLQERSSSGIFAIPNPVKSKTWINTGQQEVPVDYWLLNSVGECVLSSSMQVCNGGFWLNLDQLPSGIYVLKLRLNSQSIALKLLVR